MKLVYPHKEEKQVHVINFSKAHQRKEFKLGRSAEADIIVNDISVSRQHSMISVRDHGYYIEDLHSKFGTQLLVKSVIKLDCRNHHSAKEPPYIFQIGRSLVIL